MNSQAHSINFQPETSYRCWCPRQQQMPERDARLYLKGLVDEIDDEFDRYAQAINENEACRMFLVKVKSNSEEINNNAEMFFSHFFNKYDIKGKIEFVQYP
jgi:hypothetical protein